MLLTLAEDVPSIGEVHDKHKAIYYIADYFILHVDIIICFTYIQLQKSNQRK